MSPGTVASAKASSDGNPTVANISRTSASVGPMWRGTNSSVGLRKSGMTIVVFYQALIAWKREAA